MNAVCPLAITLLFASSVFGQGSSGDVDRAIDFPDVPGYITLKCDLHLHTVFSDGDVWPNIRVLEAIRDGLDVIAVTDHIEYQPHRADIPHPNRNRSWQIAAEAARDSDLLVIRGSEITRSMPPGHANAIFVEDVNKLIISDSVEVFREAWRQGAFAFWNHPSWTAQRKDGIASLTDLHIYLINEGLLSGIEVVNDLTYSDEALQIALDHDLTIIGTSDIHGLVDWRYEVPGGGHRPITLVFAEARTSESIKEALQARRTVVWFDNTLIGRPEQLLPLVRASVRVVEVAYVGDTSVLAVSFENVSDASFVLKNLSDFTFHRFADLVTLPAHSRTVLQVKTRDRLAALQLTFQVLNAVTAPGMHPEVTFDVDVSE